KQNFTNAGKQIVPANTQVQQVQTANKFAALENEESEVDGDNQLTLGNTNNVSIPSANTQATGRALNALAPAFDPKSSGKKTRMGKSGTNEAEQIGEKNQKQRKESTAQWVSRAFAVNKVTMNQSCPEISSQEIDPEEVAEQELIKQKVKWTGGKLWDDQTEDDPDEGDLLEGYEEENVPDEETQSKEVSGNGNANKGDVQIGENTANNKNVPME
ncbi:hypothetical protein A4A49_60046, partial [Nicotiana attenuata]